MRLKQALVPVLVFLLAGVGAAWAARVAVEAVESRSLVAVREALIDAEYGWSSVLGDGLQIVIEGEAPSEAARFGAMSTAGGVVDASRVIDNMSVTETEGLAPPSFEIEILRNDGGVSLIGLIPAATDREALIAAVQSIAGEGEVVDLLESADYPVPDTWQSAVDYGIEALGAAPRAKVSIEPGHVAVTANADSASQQRRLESDLARGAPDGVRMSLTVTAPRPVVTPFTVRFTLEGEAASFDACAADNEDGQARILAAAIAAGAEGRIACPLALGAPTADWAEGVSLGIASLARLGGGAITFSDADVTLVAAEGTDAALFDTVVGEMQNALPDVFALSATLPAPVAALPEGPPQFTATLSPEGEVQLRGRVADALTNTAVENYARAAFGQANLTMGTRVAEGLPRGWSVRVLTGLEALSMLSYGALVVEPDRIALRGETGDVEARAEISRLMIEKLGRDADFDIEVAYDEALDPVVGLPSMEDCVAQIGVVTEARKITFDPGSTTLTQDTQPILDDVAEILRLCADLRLEIAGYTDSQGRDEMNLSLSQDRADAVLEALRSRRVPVGSFVAVGYGEDSPIADNETAEGREANRRIEFSQIEVAGDETPTTLEAVEAPLEGEDEVEIEDEVDGAGDSDADHGDAEHGDGTSE